MNKYIIITIVVLVVALLIAGIALLTTSTAYNELRVNCLRNTTKEVEINSCENSTLTADEVKLDTELHVKRLRNMKSNDPYEDAQLKSLAKVFAALAQSKDVNLKCKLLKLYGLPSRYDNNLTNSMPFLQERYQDQEQRLKLNREIGVLNQTISEMTDANATLREDLIDCTEKQIECLESTELLTDECAHPEPCLSLDESDGNSAFVKSLYNDTLQYVEFLTQRDYSAAFKANLNRISTFLRNAMNQATPLDLAEKELENDLQGDANKTMIFLGNDLHKDDFVINKFLL